MEITRIAMSDKPPDGLPEIRSRIVPVPTGALSYTNAIRESQDQASR